MQTFKLFFSATAGQLWSERLFILCFRESFYDKNKKKMYKIIFHLKPAVVHLNFSWDIFRLACAAGCYATRIARGHRVTTKIFFFAWSLNLSFIFSIALLVTGVCGALSTLFIEFQMSFVNISRHECLKCAVVEVPLRKTRSSAIKFEEKLFCFLWEDEERKGNHSSDSTTRWFRKYKNHSVILFLFIPQLKPVGNTKLWLPARRRSASGRNVQQH